LLARAKGSNVVALVAHHRRDAEELRGGISVYQARKTGTLPSDGGLEGRKAKDFEPEVVMSTHAFILVDSVGPPSAEDGRTTASFP
jgi:hypothetical protein